MRRTKRRKSQKMHFQEVWDSCAQKKTSEISKNELSGMLGLLCAEQDVRNIKKMHFQEFWDSCAQNKTSEISKTCTFRNPSNQNKLRCLGQHLFGWDTPSGNYVLSQNHPQSTPEVSSGQPWAPSCSSRPDEKTHCATCRFPMCLFNFIAIFPPEAKFPSSF